MSELKFVIEKSPRIAQLVHDLYENMPEIEADRAELVTESYKQTEHLPMIKRRSAAFRHILENIPIVIRPGVPSVRKATSKKLHREEEERQGVIRQDAQS